MYNIGDKIRFTIGIHHGTGVIRNIGPTHYLIEVSPAVFEVVYHDEVTGLA